MTFDVDVTTFLFLVGLRKDAGAKSSVLTPVASDASSAVLSSNKDNSSSMVIIECTAALQVHLYCRRVMFKSGFGGSNFEMWRKGYEKMSCVRVNYCLKALS